MRAFALVFAASLCFAQANPDLHTLNVSGDAEVKVVPDRVSVTFGVETRSKDLEAASVHTDAAIKRVIAAARRVGVEDGDIQTDVINIDLSYEDKSPGTISFYTANKSIQVVLKDVSKFESLLQAGLKAGANKIGDIVFSKSQLRKYRDQAREMAVKAAIEKAHAVASAAGLHIAEKPLNINSSSSGGWWFGNGRLYGYNAQNAIQNYGGGGTDRDGSVALGKISVTATVDMIFQIE